MTPPTRSANEYSARWRATQPRSAANDLLGMKSTSVEHPHSFTSSLLPQPPVSTANQNSRIPSHQDHSKIWGLYKPAQTNPRGGVGVTECIVDFLTFVDGKAAAVAFLDYEKAFELASPAAILFSLVNRGVKGNLLAFNKYYLQNRQARVKFQGTVSSYKNLENGTPQGGIISPFLYNILMENIARLELPQGVDLLIFADDVCIAARGRNKINNLQRAVNMIMEKSKELGLKIKTNKAKTMIIKDKKPERNITINNQQIEWVENFVYLGIHIDSKLNFNQELKYLRQKAAARLTL